MVLVASLAAGAVLLLPEDFARLGRHVVAGGAFFSNLLLWSEAGYFDPDAATKPLLHLWSLGIEEQFYLAWPLLLWLARGRPRWTLALCTVLPVASFIFGCLSIGSHPVAAFFSPATRIWELLVGAFVAVACLRGDRWLQGSGEVRSLAACAFLGAAILLIDEHRAFPGSWALLPVLGSALWISAPRARFNRTVLASRGLVAVGLVSYPLYLWHWPLLSFARISQGGDASPGTRAAALAASFALAWLTYAVVERWLRFGGRGRAKAIGLGISMVVVVAAGFAISRLGGLPQRFPQLVRSMLAIDAPAILAEWRIGSCFLDSNDRVEDFDKCPDRYGRHVILLWGDSHAAHLYPGMRRRLGSEHVVERTVSACPPMLGYEAHARPVCRAANDRVMDEVRRERPRIVVLAAGWYFDWNYELLRKTVRELRLSGVEQVILVGHFPQWREPVPARLVRTWRQDPFHRVPRRFADGLNLANAHVDGTLAALAREERIEFRAPEAILCNEEGCLVRLGDGDGDLTTWDQDHLTDAGSLFVVERLELPKP